MAPIQQQQRCLFTAELLQGRGASSLIATGNNWVTALHVAMVTCERIPSLNTGCKVLASIKPKEQSPQGMSLALILQYGQNTVGHS